MGTVIGVSLIEYISNDLQYDRTDLREVLGEVLVDECTSVCFEVETTEYD